MIGVHMGFIGCLQVFTKRDDPTSGHGGPWRSPNIDPTSEDMGGDGEEAVMAVLVKPQAMP